MQCIYLHGLASGPLSTKGQAFQSYFADRGIALTLPDLNTPDFFSMTVSTQMELVSSMFRPGPITLIGSSLGGLVTLLLAEKDQQIERIVLLAPAIGFLTRYERELGAAALREWKASGRRRIFHYGQNQEMDWSSAILDDLKQHPQQLKRQIPCLIFHGLNDDVVPFQDSVAYLSANEKSRLLLFHSDHQLTNALPLMVEESFRFIQEPPEFFPD
ncbi:MAG: alpha/beta fold hydrolase [Spirochaetales bacterium]|nr:alpha/beta fold hydrolase [Spirochaetales bacterium]